MAKPTLRLRLARAILGRHAKEFIPPLSFYDRFSSMFGGTVNDFRSKAEQLEANLGWCFAANNAIAEPIAAVKLKLYRKTKAGKREEIFEQDLEHEAMGGAKNWRTNAWESYGTKCARVPRWRHPLLGM
jgi:hypothetical protein